MTLSCVRFPITAANGITRRGTCFRTATFYSTIFVLWTHLVVFTIRKYTRSYNEDRKRFFTIRYQSFKYLSLPLSFSISPPLPLSPSPPLPVPLSLSLSLSLFWSSQLTAWSWFLYIYWFSCLASIYTKQTLVLIILSVTSTDRFIRCRTLLFQLTSTHGRAIFSKSTSSIVSALRDWTRFYITKETSSIQTRRQDEGHEQSFIPKTAKLKLSGFTESYHSLILVSL